MTVKVKEMPYALDLSRVVALAPPAQLPAVCRASPRELDAAFEAVTLKGAPLTHASYFTQSLVQGVVLVGLAQSVVIPVARAYATWGRYPNVFEGTSLTALCVGVVTALAGVGVAMASKAYRNARAERSLAAELATIEDAATKVKGVERAWIGQRSHKAAAEVMPLALGKRLDHMAASAHTATPSEVEEAARLQLLANLSTNDAATLAEHLELASVIIKAMSPEARVLARSLVLPSFEEKLGTDRAQRFRMARLREAVDGERLAHAADTTVVETLAKGLTLANVGVDRDRDSRVHETLESALTTLMLAALRGHTPKVRVADEYLARQLAAHFEKNGHVASITESTVVAAAEMDSPSGRNVYELTLFVEHLLLHAADARLATVPRARPARKPTGFDSLAAAINRFATHEAPLSARP